MREFQATLGGVQVFARELHDRSGLHWYVAEPLIQRVGRAICEIGVQHDLCCLEENLHIARHAPAHHVIVPHPVGEDTAGTTVASDQYGRMLIRSDLTTRDHSPWQPKMT